MVLHERFLHTSIWWVSEEGLEFENFSKKCCFLNFECQTKFYHCWAPVEKPWENPLVAPPGKILSDAHAHSKHVKWHHFCEKLCCITPSGNTIQQHQCGKQSIAGWQVVHGAFCQTITKSCQIHCQITNNMLEIISTKYFQNSATFCSLNDLLYHWTQY